MRDIAAPSLVFWIAFTGCGPAIPALPDPATATRDAAPELPAFVGAPPSGPGADAPGPARADAGRADAGVDRGMASADASVDAPTADVGHDVSPGEIAHDAAAREVPAAEVAQPDAAGADARVDAAADVPTVRAPRAGEILVDELLVDPAGNDLGHEWLELVNVGAEPLDLGALHVADDTTDVGVDAGVLAAGVRLVLGQSADAAHNGDAPVALAYGTRLAFNNGADRVALCLGPCADGDLLDVVVWMAPFGDAYVGHAVVLERDGTTCPAADPYGTGVDHGTPGRPNPPCPRDAGGDAGDHE